MKLGFVLAVPVSPVPADPSTQDGGASLFLGNSVLYALPLLLLSAVKNVVSQNLLDSAYGFFLVFVPSILSCILW